jgi:HlyD family secretion protein
MLMRRLLTWLVILGVLLGGVVAVGMRASSWWAQRLAPKYLTAEVTRGSVQTVVNSTGTVKPVLQVSVGAFTSGPIKEVYVDFNSVVKGPQRDKQGDKPGTLLALIDPQLAQAALDRDKAALKRDEAALLTQKADLKRVTELRKQAQANEGRAKQLVDKGKDYLSAMDFDQYKYAARTAEAQEDLSRANVEQAEANVELSKANVENSKTNLGYTKIFAPCDGIIIERKVDPGQTVAASFQTPELFTIAVDMDKFMYVFASVDEADMGLIRSAKQHGKRVKFTVDAYPGDLFDGEIYQIRNNSTTTQNVVTYPVIIKAPNPEMKLMPGMTANMTFPVEVKEDVLRVPAAALRYVPPVLQVRPEDRHLVETVPVAPPEPGKKTSADAKAEQSRKRHQRVVWVKDGELLRAVPVTLGLIENQYAELLDGELTEGQAVVTGTDNTFGPR